MRADTHDGPEQNRSTSEALYIVAALTFVGLGTPSCNARPGHTFWHISEELIRGGNVRLLGESGRPSERKRTKERKGMRSEQGNAGESSQSLTGLALIIECYQR